MPHTRMGRLPVQVASSPGPFSVCNIENQGGPENEAKYKLLWNEKKPPNVGKRLQNLCPNSWNKFMFIHLHTGLIASLSSNKQFHILYLVVRSFCMTWTAPSPAGVGVGLVGLAAEVPESVSSQASLSVGLGERDVSLLPLRDVCLCCWLTEEL